MKTLDEVIDAMERCSKPHYFDCKGCPYEDDDAEVGCRSDDRDADALHYLKEYRDKQSQYEYAIDRFNEQTAKLTKALADFEDDRPLDWSELKQMEGKPVWVEYADSDGFWAFVGYWFDDSECGLYRMGKEYADYVYVHDYQPDKWQAYRKERG